MVPAGTNNRGVVPPMIDDTIDTSQPRIGIAGCGRMGLPMGRALIAAGIPARGLDIRTEDRFPGLPMAFDPATFAAGLDTILTVVRDAAQTEALLFGDQNLIAHATRLQRLVLCSTLPPSFVHAVRARLPDHVHLVDAPMSGAQVAAEEARLTFILGGDPDDIDALMLHFAAMGTTFHVMGGLGTGMTAKALNNLVAAAATLATRTALSWGAASGIDGQRLLHVMHDSSGQTWFGSNFGQIEFSRDGFAAGNTIETLTKDVRCALDASDGSGEDFAEALIAAIKALPPLTDG